MNRPSGFQPMWPMSAGVRRPWDAACPRCPLEVWAAYLGRHCLPRHQHRLERALYAARVLAATGIDILTNPVCARRPAPTSSAAPVASPMSRHLAPKWRARWRFPTGCCKPLVTERSFCISYHPEHVKGCVSPYYGAVKHNLFASRSAATGCRFKQMALCHTIMRDKIVGNFM